jgi:hypothetical protein
MRLAEVAEENATLVEEVHQYDKKLTSKTRYIDELKEKNKEKQRILQEEVDTNNLTIKKLQR